MCHLRLGNILRSNVELSDLERVKFIGYEHEKIIHKLIMLSMKCTDHLIINQTDISVFTNALEILEAVGLDPNGMRNMLSNIYQAFAENYL